MKKNLKTAMMASISNVLETMFFMPIEFDEQVDLEAVGLIGEGKTTVCSLNFKGKFSGYFILFMPEKLLFTITENFMGMEKDEINKDHINGTVKELLNMVAGGTFTNFDDTLDFQLGIPDRIHLDSLPESDQKTGDNEILVVIETTQGYLAIKMVLDT